MSYRLLWLLSQVWQMLSWFKASPLAVSLESVDSSWSFLRYLSHPPGVLSEDYIKCSHENWGCLNCRNPPPQKKKSPTGHTERTPKPKYLSPKKHPFEKRKSFKPLKTQRLSKLKFFSTTSYDPRKTHLPRPTGHRRQQQAPPVQAAMIFKGYASFGRAPPRNEGMSPEKGTHLKVLTISSPTCTQIEIRPLRFWCLWAQVMLDCRS